MTAAGTTNTAASHRLTFFNITANQVEMDTLAANSNTFIMCMYWSLDFEFIPIVGNAYTFIISPSSAVYSTYALQQFSLTIEEVPEITDGFYYRNAVTPSGLTI